MVARVRGSGNNRYDYYCRRCGRVPDAPLLHDSLWERVSAQVPRCIAPRDLLCTLCVEAVLGRELELTDLMHNVGNSFLWLWYERRIARQFPVLELQPIADFPVGRLYARRTSPGGVEYWTDDIAGGQRILDTTIADLGIVRWIIDNHHVVDGTLPPPPA